VGFCDIFEYFSGVEFFLLPSIVHARPSAGNAIRWAFRCTTNKTLSVSVWTWQWSANATAPPLPLSTRRIERITFISARAQGHAEYRITLQMQNPVCSAGLRQCS